MAAPRKGTSCAGMVDNPSHCVISQRLSFGQRCLSDPSDQRLLRGFCLVSLGRIASLTCVYFQSTESAETLRGLSLVNFGSPQGLRPLAVSTDTEPGTESENSDDGEAALRAPRYSRKAGPIQQVTLASVTVLAMQGHGGTRCSTCFAACDIYSSRWFAFWP
ncbi:hypothetical protein FB451DRAFT_1163989 [Mycena latifolia]|nr:hypothetical protein FB451DRAFT_1163989 [Mycena latifolia]